MRLSSTRTSPRSGRTNPARMCRRVVFPHPEGPTSATNAPSGTVKSTASSTGSGPFGVGNVFQTSVTVILAPISPLYLLQPLQAAHEPIQQKPNHPNNDHTCYD